MYSHLFILRWKKSVAACNSSKNQTFEMKKRTRVFKTNYSPIFKHSSIAWTIALLGISQFKERKVIS
jgi:hypothetical protein